MKHTAHLLAGIALLAGCSGEPITTETTANFQVRASESQSFGADVSNDLARLRRVTAAFQEDKYDLEVRGYPAAPTAH